jgi:hypothetical protein
MLKVRQVHSASGFAFLRSRLRAPHAVIGKPVSQVAQCDLRSEFRGKSRQAVRALPRALAATDADHNKRIEGEPVAIVHHGYVRFLFQTRQAPTCDRARSRPRQEPALATSAMPCDVARSDRDESN